MKHCCVVMAGILALVACGCGGSEQGAETSRAAEFGFQTSQQTALVEEGKAAYQMYCTGCHGSKGDGNGPAARFLHPRPRNFQMANFKFSSTRSGQLPTDADLERTIKTGLRGSAMPSWDLLPVRTVRALVEYLKTFAPKKWKEYGVGTAIPEVTDPYAQTKDKSKAIARGEVLYHGFATCWTCHPAYVSTDQINKDLTAMENPTRDAFRAHLYQSEVKPNAEGEMIYPPDFKRDFVRSGSRVQDLYRSIAAGITGTAMPTWIDSMDIPKADGSGPLVTEQDVWAIAYYVQSLILERPARLSPEQIADGYGPRDRPEKILAPGELPAPPPEEATQPTGEEFNDEPAEEFHEDD